MKDGVPKSTGDSRYLRGAGWPATYEEFRQLAAQGRLPIDLAGINPAGWAVVGDALNKANLLPDDVAAALGLSGNPQVKDALRLSKDIGRIRSGSAFYDGREPIICGIIKESDIATPYFDLHFTHNFRRCVCVDSTAKKICVVDTATWRTLVSIPMDESLSSNNDSVAYATESYIVVANIGTYSNEMSFRIYRYTDSAITIITKFTVSGITYNNAGRCVGWNIPDGRYLYMFAAHSDSYAYVKQYVFDTVTSSLVVNGDYVFSGSGNSTFAEYIITGDNLCYVTTGCNRAGQGIKLYKLSGTAKTVLLDKSSLYSAGTAYDETQRLLFWAADHAYKFDAKTGTMLSSSNVSFGSDVIAKDGYLYFGNSVYNYNFEDVTEQIPSRRGYASAMKLPTTYGSGTAYVLGYGTRDANSFFIEELGMIFSTSSSIINGTIGKGNFQYLMGYSK